MGKPRRIHQFIPVNKHQAIPGRYGWGVDVGEAWQYRVVMYAPQKHDEPIVNSTIIHAYSGEVERVHKSKKSRRSDHGPAHIHVIHKKSGREIKFELIQGIHLNESFALQLKKSRDKIPLEEKELEEVEELLKPWVPQFIQLWNELYAETPLKQCVSRISEKDPNTIERVHYIAPDNIQVLLTNIHTRQLEQLGFDDYISRPPAGR